MSTAILIESVPAECMGRLAQRALDATKQLRAQFFSGSDESIPTSPDSYRQANEGSCPKARFYQFGLGVLASTFVGTAVNASEDATSLPSVSVDYVRRLAIANQLATPVVEWEIPTVEHNWTPESCRIRQLVREFSESFHADY
jgi:hypothetical protein